MDEDQNNNDFIAHKPLCAFSRHSYRPLTTLQVRYRYATHSAINGPPLRCCDRHVESRAELVPTTISVSQAWPTMWEDINY